MTIDLGNIDVWPNRGFKLVCTCGPEICRKLRCVDPYGLESVCLAQTKDEHAALCVGEGRNGIWEGLWQASTSRLHLNSLQIGSRTPEPSDSLIELLLKIRQPRPLLPAY